MKKFIDLLTDVEYATDVQKKKELWDVQGILKDRLNQKLKFDLRPLKNDSKVGSLNTKADKMVFDMIKEYVIVDIEELHKHLKQRNTRKVYLDNLILELDWNIVLAKD